jgi:hypothetical protein
MIPEEHKQDIIQSGINFIRSVTEAYGSDEGMKLWETVADTLDPSIKGHIFFAMLTGEYNSVISIYKSNEHNGGNKVSMIKALRTVDKRRLGLKEAKDMCDSLLTGNTIRVEVEPNTRNSSLLQLRSAGFCI